jgi:hypothetical protein
MSGPHKGGPASPITAEQHPNGIATEMSMTLRSYFAERALRDYFAAKALQGMLAHPECDYTPMTASAQVQAAADAYGLADAMLKARAA